MASALKMVLRKHFHMCHYKSVFEVLLSKLIPLHLSFPPDQFPHGMLCSTLVIIFPVI